METEELAVSTEHGPWQILRRGDSIAIIDHAGRLRHMSRGHTKTATFLAFELATNPFETSDLADAHMRHAARHFAEGGFDLTPEFAEACDLEQKALEGTGGILAVSHEFWAELQSQQPADPQPDTQEQP
jgi:hypothetical protein